LQQLKAAVSNYVAQEIANFAKDPQKLLTTTLAAAAM
jgi:hypothetical protein